MGANETEKLEWGTSINKYSLHEETLTGYVCPGCGQAGLKEIESKDGASRWYCDGCEDVTLVPSLDAWTKAFYPPKPKQPLTIDQLRAWLEQREREASEAADNQQAAFLASSAGYEKHRLWSVFVDTAARRDLYRELLAAIEKGELPE